MEVDPDLNFVDYWNLPEAEQIGDSDFGSVPTLYDDSDATGIGELAADANKNGTVFAFDRQHLSAGPIWQTVVAEGSEDASVGGSIAPMAYDGSRLFVAGGATTIGGQSCGAGLRALDPTNGSVEWADYFAQGPPIWGFDWSEWCRCRLREEFDYRRVCTQWQPALPFRSTRNRGLLERRNDLKRPDLRG